MTTNQTIDGVPRELLERISERLNETGQFLLAEELHATLAESAPIIGGEVDRLSGMLDAASELLRTRQRVNRELRSELERIKAINDNNFKLVLDLLFKPSIPVVEGQDEQRQQATGNENEKFEAWREDQIAALVRMGYPDAAKAFRELGSIQWAGWQGRANQATQQKGQPAAWIKPDVLETLRKDECCYAFGSQNPKGTLIPLYAEQPAPVAVPRLEMAHVVRAHMEIPGCPVLTSNQCHALAMKLNESLNHSL